MQFWSLLSIFQTKDYKQGTKLQFIAINYLTSIKSPWKSENKYGFWVTTIPARPHASPSAPSEANFPNVQ